MEEYKICPFCGKATDAAMSSCRFCNGLIKFRRLDCTDGVGAALINNPYTDEGRPLVNFSPYDFSIVRNLPFISSGLLILGLYLYFCGSPYLVVVSFIFLLTFIGSWLLFARFLRKFSGLDQIYKPLQVMGICYFSFIAIFFTIPWIFFIPFMSLFSGIALITGFILFIVAAVRMKRNRNDYIKLDILGNLIIRSLIGFAVTIFIFICFNFIVPLKYLLVGVAAFFSILPSLYLVKVVAMVRKKL